MSAALAAHYPAPTDRRYSDLASHYDTSAFFASYPPPSLTAVTDSAYPLPTTTHSSPYPWDAHDHPVQSASFPTSSSSSLSAPAHPGYSSSSSAHSGPTSLSYSPDYPAHRPAPAARSYPQPPPAPSSGSPSALPSSASRPTYSSGSRSYSALAAAAANNLASSPSASRLQNAHWDSSSLYTIDPPDALSPPPSSPSSTPQTPPIKEEDPEGGFIIEVSVPAEQPTISPMPEVPLRAIHAPPEMRKRMCSFRLENFAMHDGIRSAATQPGSGGIEVGPLREEPVELEWQVELDEPLVPQTDLPRYTSLPHMHPKPSSRSSDPYRTASPPSPRLHPRTLYGSVGSPSPPLSLDYPPAVDSDSWDSSSAYSSVTTSGSGSTAGTTGSPSFASVMTPAQSLSLGWPRYQTSAVDVDASAYRRTGSSQNSLSRVSQPHGQFVFGASSKSAYQPPSQYGYDSAGFSRGNASSSRYSEDEYASSSSPGSNWYSARS